jgi:hypothetical protein
VLAGEAEHVHAAGQLDDLRRPVPGDEDRVEPLDGDDRDALGAADGDADGVDAGALARDELDRRVARVGELGDGAHVAERLAERVRVERDDVRVGRDRAGHLAHVVVADRAHRAQLLGDDEVGLEVVQEIGVELVDRLAALGVLADGGVDLGRRQVRRQPVARDVRQRARRFGEVALVRDPDDVVAEPEREEQLGCVWDEADDPHAQQQDGSPRRASV